MDRITRKESPFTYVMGADPGINTGDITETRKVRNTEQPKDCSPCKGTGDNGMYEACPHCKGTGEDIKMSDTKYDLYDPEDVSTWSKQARQHRKAMLRQKSDIEYAGGLCDDELAEIENEGRKEFGIGIK